MIVSQKIACGIKYKVKTIQISNGFMLAACIFCVVFRCLRKNARANRSPKEKNVEAGYPKKTTTTTRRNASHRRNASNGTRRKRKLHTESAGCQSKKKRKKCEIEEKMYQQKA